MSTLKNHITVSQLNLYVKSLLEGNARLAFITVKGEISNFKNHYASGHWYFTLKDSGAAIRCVMFRSAAARVRFTPQDGMSVLLSGRVSIYEKDGQYQFYAEEMCDEGEGELALRFKLIKEKLEKEGLFDEENKRPVPKNPKKIAVITSNTGAAVQDIINITARRYPLCSLLLCPVAVQGERAVPDMLRALGTVYERDDVDTIIIGRGGGSEEDLAAFNDEMLARKIYESPVPVISAVGHETDFSISDFVADLRAPTPSAAAELAVPDMAELLGRVLKARQRAISALTAKYNFCSLKSEQYKNLFSLSRLEAMVNDRELTADKCCDRLCLAFKNRLKQKENLFATAAARLDGLNPLKTLMRGFAAVSKNETAVKSAYDISEGDSLTLRFSDGSAVCQTKEVRRNQNG